WWWGVVALALGVVTALFGVIYAAVQTDMKRLLAYSSVENIGIIVAGFGLTILFRAYGKNLLAAITLTAVLYHALNHAFFKTLLFLVTGSVLHATKERSLGKLGGLIHRMPWVAWLALVGTLAIAGLPPLNGFVSEWLLLAPINADRSSYSPLIVLVVIIATVVLTMRIVHRFYHGRIRTAPPWDCGFPLQTPRMQDSAEGFGQPIRQVFEPFFRIERHLPTSFDAAPRYFVRIGDPFWSWIFLPIAHAAEFA